VIWGKKEKQLRAELTNLRARDRQQVTMSFQDAWRRMQAQINPSAQPDLWEAMTLIRSWIHGSDELRVEVDALKEKLKRCEETSSD